MCFPTEEAFEKAFMSYGQSLEAQLLLDGKLAESSVAINQSLNTPVWYNGEDWAEDNVFTIYQMEVSNPGAYLKQIKSFTQKMAKK